MIQSGPLPDPVTMQAYDNIVPGAAKHIVEAFVKQVDHRIDIEKKVVSHDMFIEKSGQIFAFILALVTLIGSFVLVYFGHSIVGISGIIIAIACLIAAFIYKKKNN